MFPAHAGMNRPMTCSSVEPISVPRSRGDEPPSRDLIESAVWVFPAHAGMNRRVTGTVPIPHRVPRSRGDEPEVIQLLNQLKPCSPLTRG